MCYKKPGPRCSGHAKKRLDAAKEAYAAERTAANRKDYEAAYKEYLTTPDGIQELRDAGEDEKADKAQKRRERMIRAYKKAKAAEDYEKSKINNDVLWDKPVKLDGLRPDKRIDMYNPHIYQVGENTFILSDRSSESRDNWRKFWMEENGHVTGFLNTLDHQKGEADDLVLTAVEIRDGWRGQGKSKKLLDAVHLVADRQLHTNGHCTPKGIQLKGKLPLTKYGEWEVQFNNMDFVDDDECWENGWFS